MLLALSEGGALAEKYVPLLFWVWPFIAVLLSIAILPLLRKTHHWWEENRNKLKLIRDFNRNLQGQHSREQQPADQHRDLPPSRVKAKAAYEYALTVIEGAKDMTIADLFEALKSRLDTEIAKAHGQQMERLQEFKDSLPPNPETFGKYLRDAGIRRYNSRGEPRPTRSIRRRGEL